MKKKFLAAIAAGLIALSSFNVVDAASRAEISAIQVQSASDFKYWNENSPTLAKIVDFVQDISNPNSENYIPPEDRVATFDLDGTIYCETAPYLYNKFEKQKLIDVDLYASIIDIAERERSYPT